VAFEDREHQGQGGWTTGQLLAALPGWLEETGAPDIVIFSSPGGNDGLQGLSFEEALANVNTIIDVLQEANPRVTILLGQPAPPKNGDAELLADLEAMQQNVPLIAAEQTTTTSLVIAVDLFTDFDPQAMIADNVHYNELGADFIATRLYKVLSGVLEP